MNLVGCRSTLREFKKNFKKRKKSYCGLARGPEGEFGCNKPSNLKLKKYFETGATQLTREKLYERYLKEKRYDRRILVGVYNT